MRRPSFSAEQGNRMSNKDKDAKRVALQSLSGVWQHTGYQMSVELTSGDDLEIGSSICTNASTCWCGHGSASQQ